jgi:putative transposase
MKDSCFPITEVWLKSKEAELLLGNKMKLSRLRNKNLVTVRPAAEGRGGGFEYLLSSLPVEAKSKWLEASGERQDVSLQSTISSLQPEISNNDYQPAEIDLYNEQQQSKNLVVSEKETQIHVAKNKIVDLYLQYQEKSNLKKLAAQKEFCKLYNLGLHPDLQSIIATVSRGSVERWKKTREEEKENPFALAPKYNRTQRSEISVKQAKWLLAQYLSPNQRQMTEIAEDAVKFFSNVENETPLHPSTYRRFLQRFHRYNSDLVSYYRLGGDKALNDNDLPYITRDKSRVAVGTIIIADGHKLDFLVNDPITGKPKRMMLILFIDYYSNTPLGYEICTTENVKGISIALFRSILYLGKYPDVVYLDNGRAFAAKFFKGKEQQIETEIGLYKSLGIKVITAWPYHGQSKTIEPFFRQVAALARRMPSYIGNTIALQPAYMHRGEKLHARVHDRMMEHVNIDLRTAYKAISWQFEEYTNTPQKGGFLKGQKPIEIFNQGKGPGVDKINLVTLMMKRESVMIKRCQFKIREKEYQSEDLYGLSGEFEVRYDFIYDDVAYVFDPENGHKFIGAVPVKPQVHPAAFALGTEEDQQLLSERIEFRNNLRKATTTDARLFLENEIYPAVTRQLEDAKILQLNAEAKKSSTPEEQKKSLKLKTGTDNVDLSFLNNVKTDIEEERSWI